MQHHVEVFGRDGTMHDECRRCFLLAPMAGFSRTLIFLRGNSASRRETYHYEIQIACLGRDEFNACSDLLARISMRTDDDFIITPYHLSSSLRALMPSLYVAIFICSHDEGF